MRNPFLFDDIDVLRNLGNIRDAEELRRAEGDTTIEGYYVADYKEQPHTYMDDKDNGESQ
ncbi:MAG: hypothetical protein LBK75_09065 [Oscillospiraceae bacterium]|jgi:hypothetical protein|nr:hypothetical protein [Oscillospiraceae bacterium]